MRSPTVNVGILTGNTISFLFFEEYVHKETVEFLVGEQRALLVNNKILFNGKLYTELFFEPVSRATASFGLKAVVIGKDFHWQREEDQTFKGALNLLATPQGIVAINEVSVEDYLTSVISSEMSATASEELLKAHAVISRSWLMAQMEKSKDKEINRDTYPSYNKDQYRLIRWYDREDHLLFDVCADDHCQRYQGITKISVPEVEKAVLETQGEILMYDGKICDTRFSKCCGGVTEKFEHCWEPTPHAYLTAVRDSTDTDLPDLTIEENADKWIRSSPASFCNTNDKSILGQILNNYDLETSDFFRWQVELSQSELRSLLCRKIKDIDFGEITELVPMRRGLSGRIEELKIIGTKRTYVIGKELEIRRALSESHLYSSAFIIDKENVADGIPGNFILTGAGWGHGVGLCQIGAAVMGEKGYTYKEILTHYYPGSAIIGKY